MYSLVGGRPERSGSGSGVDTDVDVDSNPGVEDGEDGEEEGEEEEKMGKELLLQVCDLTAVQECCFRSVFRMVASRVLSRGFACSRGIGCSSVFCGILVRLPVLIF